MANRPEHKGTWTLSLDGASSTKGSGAGVILEDPKGGMIEQD